MKTKSQMNIHTKDLFNSKKVIDRLMKVNRSITGEGVRKSLNILQKKTPFTIHEVRSGTRVFDWSVPQEWVIKNATLSDNKGKIWADYKSDFLQLVSYSEPVDANFTFNKLKRHLYTSELENAIPYRTSYYRKNWGFCLSKDILNKMDRKSTYHVKIDSEFRNGSLTYGEKTIKGDTDEYMISTYCCHPNLINDNTAGMAMWADLLASMGKTKHTYRFIIAPETIGMITYLATNNVSNIKGAIILSHTVGDGPLQFKNSFLTNSYIDRIARQVLEVETPFSIRGSDERQLSSPAFRIPTIVVNKGGLYSNNYHTSLDRQYSQLDYKTTFSAIKKIVYYIENDKIVENLNPQCEPMLGKRNLYPNIGGSNQNDKDSEVMLWILFYSGDRLLDIAEKTGIPMQKVIDAANKLQINNLIK